MRAMARIVTVANKGKMFEKDKICYVSFEETAYECIVPITVNIGDKMVFIEADSILPEIARWEFLRKRCYKEDLHGFLIKCMTMGKKANEDGTDSGERVKSWGLCVTLAEAGLEDKYKAGDDVTDLLEIRKYEPAEDASPKATKLPKFIQFCYKHKLFRWIAKLYKKLNSPLSGSFPTEIISKSDETTIQNCKSIINDFAGKRAYITAKMEGQSFTCSLDLKHKNKFYVCSRNNRYNNDKSTGAKAFFAAAKQYSIENKLKEYYKKTGIVLMIQGEQCGPGIQGNIYNFKDYHWFVFRVKGYEDKTWVEYNFEKFAPIVNELGLETVPLLEVVEDMSKYNTVDALVKKAEECYWIIKQGNLVADYKPAANEKLWKDYCQHEGIVIKSNDYNKELNLGFSFKVKNMAYQEKDFSEIAKVFKK